MLISLEPCRLTWSSDDFRELYDCVMAKSICHPFALVSLQEATAYLNYEKSGGAESQWYIVGDEERKQYIPKDPEDFARTLDDSRKGLSQLIFLMSLEAFWSQKQQESPLTPTSTTAPIPPPPKNVTKKWNFLTVRTPKNT